MNTKNKVKETIKTIRTVKKMQDYLAWSEEEDYYDIYRWHLVSLIMSCDNFIASVSLGRKRVRRILKDALHRYFSNVRQVGGDCCEYTFARARRMVFLFEKLFEQKKQEKPSEREILDKKLDRVWHDYFHHNLVPWEFHRGKSMGKFFVSRAGFWTEKTTHVSPEEADPLQHYPGDW